MRRQILHPVGRQVEDFRLAIKCHIKSISNPNLPGSFVPEKAGELMAAPHISLACRALRRYLIYLYRSPGVHFL